MFIPRVTSPHTLKHAIAHALLAGVTLTVVPTFAQQEQIESTKSVIAIHVFKSGLFSSFAHDHVIQAPIASGRIDLRAESVTLSFNVGDMRVLDPGASDSERKDIDAPFCWWQLRQPTFQLAAPHTSIPCRHCGRSRLDRTRRRFAKRESSDHRMGVKSPPVNS